MHGSILWYLRPGRTGGGRVLLKVATQTRSIEMTAKDVIAFATPFERADIGRISDQAALKSGQIDHVALACPGHRSAQTAHAGIVTTCDIRVRR
jgi:hypothetical protein